VIKIINYKAGNAPSVLHAVTRLGYKAEFARCPQDLKDAAHIILPGVGSARATMESLREMDLPTALEEAVIWKKTLFLGVCVGMQILFEHSEEENTDCFGWLRGKVVKFDNSNVRVPQMGWNHVQFMKGPFGKIWHDFFYFVNSYYAMPDDKSDIWGKADYNGPFAAAVCRDNIFATQFHIEKSGEAGLELLDGFLSHKGG